MKKFIVLLPAMLLLLTGCGEKTGTIKCTLEQDQSSLGYTLNSEYNINYKGDLVESVETKEIVKSDSKEVLESFETTLNETYGQLDKKYGGYDFKVTNKDGQVVSDVKIDYNKMDIKQYASDEPTLKSFVKDDKLTVEGLKSMYKTLGATCEE